MTPEPADKATPRAAYVARPEAFAAPSLSEAAHILFAVPPVNAELRGGARQGVRLVFDQLRDGPGSFSQMALQDSACAAKTSDGMLGQLTTGDTAPEFEAVLATMAEGEARLA